MEETLKQILNELQKTNNSLDSLEKQLGSGIAELKAGQETLQKSLIKTLGVYTDKIVEHVDDKTAPLNKRVFAVETDIQLISKQ